MATVRITALGGAREIGASSFWCEMSDVGILVDYGARPGKRGTRAYPDGSVVAASGKPVASLVLTHAHHDHSGALPIFHRSYPGARVYGTPATLRISETLLADSLHIMEREDAHAPDYTSEEVASLLSTFTPVSFNEPHVIADTPASTIVARFHHAGHILGAAMVVLDFIDRRTLRTSRVLFSGDVSAFDQPTLRGTDIEAIRGSNPDLLVLEGTYGARDHAAHDIEAARFVTEIAAALREGGRVVVPAFAVGRAQNVAVLLRRAMDDPSFVRQATGDTSFTFPDATVYIDGMCRTVSEHYDAFRELLHPDLREEMRSERHCFFDSSGRIRKVGSVAERKRIAEGPGPWVVISSSGMLTGGAVVTYVRAIADDPDASVFLVGYQDEESPGAALQRLERRRAGEAARIRLEGETISFRARARRYGLSAHSDARDLEALCRIAAPESIRLVHGDVRALSDLTRRLGESLSEPRHPADVAILSPLEPLDVADLPIAQRPDVLGAVLSAVSAAAPLPGADRGTWTGSGAGALAFEIRLRKGPDAWVSEREVATWLAGGGEVTDADLDLSRQMLQSPAFIRRRIAYAEWVYAPARKSPGAGSVPRDLPTLPAEGTLAVAEIDGRIRPIIRYPESKTVLTAEGVRELFARDGFADVQRWVFLTPDDFARERALLERLAEWIRWREERPRENGLDPEQASKALWDAVANGKIEMDDAVLAISLLTLPGLETGVSLACVLTHLGRSEDEMDDPLIDQLDRLAEGGFLAFGNRGAEIDMRWIVSDGEERRGLPPAPLDILLAARIEAAVDLLAARRRERIRVESLEPSSIPAPRRSAVVA